VDIIGNIGLGFSTALSIENLIYCFIGCLLGTMIGVLPGIGPAATVAMLLPITFTLDPTSALIMLAGIFYGAQYGGSTTAILVNIPGEATSVVTTLDGYQMARQGRAGAALATAALGSFFAGTVATILIALFAPVLVEIAVEFGATEYFSLMVLGLIASVVLARGSLIKALAMVVVGLTLGIVGMDINSGVIRLTFGNVELTDGVSIVAIAMGVFGLGEIIHNLEQREKRQALGVKINALMPTRADLRAMTMPIIRGTALGSMLGILPGGGALLSSFASYSLEKKLARDPGRFGAGAIEGVAGPESANNAGAQTSFVPMLALGVPTNTVMALMIGAMVIQGVQPGPGVMSQQPALFWGLIASMWIGNLMLVVLNLPLIGVWVKLLSIPYRYLFPAILVFCSIGVFTIDNSVFDIYAMILFGLVGYVLRKLDCEPAPMLLGVILGPMLEENFRRALLLSRGDYTIFVSQPISAALLATAVVALVVVTIPVIRKEREHAFKD
jgi:TctA family transporter